MGRLVEPQRFFQEFSVLDVSAFTAHCQSIFFPAEEYSIATYILVNAGLLVLFRDLNASSRAQIGVHEDELGPNIRICAQNVDAAVQTLHLFLAPTVENIQAVFLAVVIPKFAISRSLNSRK